MTMWSLRGGKQTVFDITLAFGTILQNFFIATGICNVLSSNYKDVPLINWVISVSDADIESSRSISPLHFHKKKKKNWNKFNHVYNDAVSKENIRRGDTCDTQVGQGFVNK